METKKSADFEITLEMEKEWAEKGERFVLFDIDCGGGKTREVLNMMKRHEDEMMLYLVPRVELLKSVENRAALVGLNNIRVMTIQDLYHVLKRLSNNALLLDAFKWVCIDEVQQCILDSPYNKSMGMTVSMLVKSFKGTLLMLTGTDVGISDVFRQAYGINVKTYRKKEGRAKWLTTDAFAFLPNIDKVADVIHRAVLKGEKVLFFSSTIENIYKVSELITAETMAVVSKYSKHSTRLCGRKREQINKLIDEEAVPNGYGVVLATKAVDVGINIHDKSVTTVIVDTLEIATAIQQINRKRRNGDECVDVYFLLPNAYKISNNIKKFRKELKDYELFCNDIQAWQRKHKCERISEKGIVYAVPDEIGTGVHYEIDFFYLQYIRYMFRTALKNEQVSGYKSSVEAALGVPSVTLLSAGKKTLEELVGIKLATAEEKQWLIDLFEENFRSATYLNMLLVEKNLPYKIITGVHKELPSRNGKRHECRSAWMLVRIDQ